MMGVMTRIAILRGDHSENSDGHACLLEWVAILSGEEWTDMPRCACPVAAAFGRVTNDSIVDTALRTRLLAPLIPMRVVDGVVTVGDGPGLLGSRSTPDVERRRGYIAADYAVRVFLPMALDSAQLPEWASKMRGLPSIVDRETAHAGWRLAAKAEKTGGFSAAVYAAAYAAASAHDAYGAAYANAADYAATSAAYAADAAADAAYDADAAADVVDRVRIYEAAADCLRAMCEVRS